MEQSISHYAAHLVNVLSYSIVVMFCAVVALFGYMALMRVVLARRERSDEARKESVRPLALDILTSDGSPEEAVWKLAHLTTKKDRRALDEVLLQYARIVRGPEKELLTRVFEQMGFVAEDIDRIDGGNHLEQAEAAYHLGMMGSTRAVPYLLERLRSEDAAVVFASLDALSHIGTRAAIDGVMAYLNAGGRLQSSRISEVLLERTDEFSPLIIDELERGDARGDLKDVLIDTEGAMRDRRAVALLTSFMESDREEAVTRAKAARSLGRIGEVESCDHLEKALEDPEALVRAEAAEALGRLGCSGSVDSLGRALLDEVFEVRVNAAFALTKLGEGGAEVLERSLLAAGLSEREVAAEALDTVAVRRGASRGDDGT